MLKFDKSLRSGLTTRNLVILGLLLILASNLFSVQILNMKLHEMLANIGALILIVGTLQWFFDEDSRSELISNVTEAIRNYLERRDQLTSNGLTDCVLDSKILAGHETREILIKSEQFAIGIHYSDGTIARYEKVIQERLALKKITQIVHSNDQGIAVAYLEKSITPAVDLPKRIELLRQLIKGKFGENNNLIKLVTHERVLHYSFIYSDHFLWIIFMTSTSHYEPQVPALCLSAGSPLFEFFKNDIKCLGVSV